MPLQSMQCLAAFLSITSDTMTNHCTSRSGLKTSDIHITLPVSLGHALGKNSTFHIG